MTLPSHLCNVTLRAVSTEHFLLFLAQRRWWSCDNTKQFNAMMSHHLIQAFAEHEKHFCAKYFLLCLFYSNTHCWIRTARRRRWFREHFVSFSSATSHGDNKHLTNSWQSLNHRMVSGCFMMSYPNSAPLKEQLNTFKSRNLLLTSRRLSSSRFQTDTQVFHWLSFYFSYMRSSSSIFRKDI